MKSPLKSWTVLINLGLIVAAKVWPKLGEAVCSNPQLSMEVVAMLNLFLRFKTKERLSVKKKLKTIPMSGIVASLLLPFMFGCATAEVRYDAAPSPLDENHHTLLLESDCGDGVKKTGFGQMGCSYGFKEPVVGSFTIHSPLPSVVKMYSKDCDIEISDFHGEAGGSFQYDLATGNKGGPFLPAAVRACVVDIYVKWQVPPKMKQPQYELRGMSGRLYLRRRPENTEAASMRWLPSNIATKGISWAQVREFPGRDVVGQLQLEIAAPELIKSGKHRLYGCGKGIEGQAADGTNFLITREQLLGSTWNKGRCMYFGYSTGTSVFGSWIDADAVLGVEIHGTGVQHLASDLRVTETEVCYDTESAVSLAVLNYGATNRASNKVRDCFKLPEDGNARLGLFTHKGRALYAIIEAGKIIEVFQ